jgi:hypothetical protein
LEITIAPKVPSSTSKSSAGFDIFLKLRTQLWDPMKKMRMICCGKIKARVAAEHGVQSGRREKDARGGRERVSRRCVDVRIYLQR